MKKKIVYNVLDFGAVPDGETLNTTFVQKAIDNCSITGGVVFFPAGKFVLSTVFLKSNVSICFSFGTLILGSKNFDEYEKNETLKYKLYQDVSHSYFNNSLFVGINCHNISICGNGIIDMRSIWDCENTKKMNYRGAKCIALKECDNVQLSNFSIFNATDLAVYLAGCEKSTISNLKLRVYIDGISLDNCVDSIIKNCYIESGDDGIVFKSSYTLNRLAVCRNVKVFNCRIKSRCNALKFGTESIGGFCNFICDKINIRETRFSGIAIESVDGAIIEDIKISNVNMKNVNVPFFVHLGTRMNAPQDRKIGTIKNICFENITSKGPYIPYEITSWNYASFKDNNTLQYPWLYDTSNINSNFNAKTCEDVWQMTSNVCGLKDHYLENITFSNIDIVVVGGAKENNFEALEVSPSSYPEVFAYGKYLPCYGIYFRYIEKLKLNNVRIKTIRKDVRKDIILEKVR